MADEDLEKAVAKINKDIDTLSTLKEKMDLVFDKSKESKKEERDFQIRMQKIQIYTNKCHSILSIKFSFTIFILGFGAIFYPFYTQATLAGNPNSTNGLVGLGGFTIMAVIGLVYTFRNVQISNRA